MIKPMLCQDTQGDFSRIPTDGWVMERKFDGWRVFFDRTPEGVRTYSGRNGSERTGSARFLEASLAFLPPGTLLDGELIADGHSGAVATALASGGDLAFVMFDVLRVAGTDVTDYPWSVRRELLEKISEGVSENPNIRLNPAVPVSQKTYDAWVKLGLEGSVAKRIDSRYRPGYRSPDWLKCKATLTDDARVVGFERGKGQSNKHLVGAFRLQMLATGAETSCSTSRVPAIEYAKAEDSGWLGRIIEVKHYGLFEGGHPRHPVYSRRREDLE
jgi:bifunctional non-homologous end joining protein LigD